LQANLDTQNSLKCHESELLQGTEVTVAGKVESCDVPQTEVKSRLYGKGGLGWLSKKNPLTRTHTGVRDAKEIMKGEEAFQFMLGQQVIENHSNDGKAVVGL
jgi:hypothetical protein